MSKHTPGPWMWENESSDWPDTILISGTSDQVMWWDFDLGIRFDNKANANLIAQAPALLEELEDRYHDTKCGCGHPACRRCQADARTLAVIQKAKGETE